MAMICLGYMLGQQRIHVVYEVAKGRRVGHLYQRDYLVRIARTDVPAMSAGLSAGDAEAR